MVKLLDSTDSRSNVGLSDFIFDNYRSPESFFTNTIPSKIANITARSSMFNGVVGVRY